MGQDEVGDSFDWIAGQDVVDRRLRALRAAGPSRPPGSQLSQVIAASQQSGTYPLKTRCDRCHHPRSPLLEATTGAIEARATTTISHDYKRLPNSSASESCSATRTAKGEHYADHQQSKISTRLTANGQLAASMHELGHALVALNGHAPNLSYAKEGLTAESVAWSVRQTTG